MTNRYELAKADERAHVATVFGEVASGGGTLNLNLKNPASNNTDLVLVGLIVSTQFKGTYTIHDAFTSGPSGGTTVTIQNLLMDDEDTTADSGAMECNKDVTFTADSQHIKQAIPSGGQGASQEGGQTLGTDPIIEPGREIVIEVTNTSTSNANGSINVIYHEGNRP